MVKRFVYAHVLIISSNEGNEFDEEGSKLVYDYKFGGFNLMTCKLHSLLSVGDSPHCMNITNKVFDEKLQI